MLSYQPTFFAQTEELTSELFSRLIISDDVVNTIKRVRAYVEESAKRTEAGDDQNAKLFNEQAQKMKRRLPMICWQATFDVSLSAKGYEGRWRKQSAARLNGLFMTDVDHLPDPEQTIRDMVARSNSDDLKSMCSLHNILLMHITPSGHGLRIVAKAQPERGNLSDNQHALAALLGVQVDEACKDASRLSFCPMFDDIKFINAQELFNYENKEYDDKFGPQYRGNDSRPSRPAVARSGHAAASAGLPAGGSKPAGVSEDGKALSVGSEKQSSASVEGDNEFRGVTYEKIISEWFRQNGGEPNVGERHLKLLKLASSLRYICDNKAERVIRAIRQHPVGEAYAVADAADLAAIANSVVEKQMWSDIPKRFRQVLSNAGVQLDDDNGNTEAEKLPAADYDGYARRLLPLLSESPGLREAVINIPDHLKLGGVLAATAMLGTYLTRCWWEHFDGRIYRLSFLTYIVGAAASGKSFLTDLDRLLMDPLKAADRVGRAAEQQYKELQKRRKASEKLPDMPHPVIRYCPSTTSNAILYRRLQDAVDEKVLDPNTGEPLHLHLITVESELATALRAQVGSWAGKNDLELKSFHNEAAGVDYANADSTNGIMQVNWNQVVSGTQESMSRKIKPANVLDGLVTRLSLFLMPSNDYKMLERRRYLRDNDRECRLRQLGYKLEGIKGELATPRLLEFCYEYEEKLTRQAQLEQDRCLDYFRKRIPVIMMRHTLVRMVLRQMDELLKGEPLQERDDDLEYAKLIGDWCLEMQITMFGQMVMDALEKEQATFVPRRAQAKTRELFEKLDEKFTFSELAEYSQIKNNATLRSKVQRWLNDGFIVRLDKTTYKKNFQSL